MVIQRFILFLRKTNAKPLPRKIDIMCEWTLIPALEHPLQQLIHSVFGLPPRPSICKCQIPLRTHFLRYHTDYSAQIKASDTHTKINLDDKKRQTGISPDKSPYTVMINWIAASTNSRAHCRVFVFTNHLSWLFFFLQKRPHIVDIPNQFRNQSSIRLEKSWISFDYPLANSHRTKRLLNFVLGIKVL